MEEILLNFAKILLLISTHNGLPQFILVKLQESFPHTVQGKFLFWQTIQVKAIGKEKFGE